MLVLTCGEAVGRWYKHETSRTLLYTDRHGSSVGPPWAASISQRKTSIFFKVAAHFGYLFLNVQPERSEFSLICKGPFLEKSDCLGDSPDSHPNLFGARDQLQPRSASSRLKTGLSPLQDVQRTSRHHPEGWRSFHNLGEQRKFCLWLLCEQDQDSYDCHYLIFPKLPK